MIVKEMGSPSARFGGFATSGKVTMPGTETTAALLGRIAMPALYSWRPGQIACAGEDCQFLLLQGVGAYDFNKVQD